MLAVGVAIAVICAVGWLIYRWVSAPRSRSVPQTPLAVPRQPLCVAEANDAAAERLWKLAYAVPFAAESAAARAHERVRHNIVAVLEVDELDPRYFPRRPALLPQLLQAVDDPNVATDRVARMIAHDPVLAADVLRMANSSLYRTSSAPIESIRRAVVVCGADALRGMLAAALLQPVFRATRKNFPRVPRLLWERTQRAHRAAELFSLSRQPKDRFEAQLLVLLSAIGPLVVYGAIVDVYARNPHLSPSPELCIDLTRAMSPPMALRIARDWQISPRMVAALEKSPQESLSAALQVAELIGTVSLLEAQTVITSDERKSLLRSTGAPDELVRAIWGRVTHS